MARTLVAIAVGLAVAADLSGCARGKIREISKKLDAAQGAVDEVRNRAHAFEARLQAAENLVSQRSDLATRMVGRWSGVAVQASGGGEFKENSGQSVTFNSDGSVSNAKLPDLAGNFRYRVINSGLVVLSGPGGRRQILTNVSVDGNRLSFLVGSSNPTPVVLTRQ